MPTQLSKVEFSNNDQPELFGMGWGEVEVNDRGNSKRWSVAERAELFLPLPAGNDLTLSFRLLSASGLDNQNMKVSVNGEVVDSRKLESHVQTVTVNVAEGLITAPVSKLVLEFSEVKEPRTADKRRISVSFFELNIYPSAERQ